MSTKYSIPALQSSQKLSVTFKVVDFVVYFKKGGVLMKHNMGILERVLRLIYGAGVLAVGWVLFNTADLFRGGVGTETITGLIVSIIGLAVLVTGAVAYCPINALIHANSCKACRVGATHTHKPV
jgi:Inner membrane protein YgaP-like, transmembrane domain